MKHLVFVWLYSDFPVFQIMIVEGILVLYSGEFGIQS